MAAKNTFINCITYDWDARDTDKFFNDRSMTRDRWEGGVRDTLELLGLRPPCQSSSAVIDALKATGKTVTIIPFTMNSWEIADGRLKAKLNAGAVANDKMKATVPGKRSDELPNWVIDQIKNTPIGPERDKLEASLQGTGEGSDSTLSFNAQDWAPASPTWGWTRSTRPSSTNSSTRSARPRAKRNRTT